MSICNSAGILANACQISIKFCVFRTKSDTNVSKFHGIRLNFSVSIKPSAIFLDSALFRIFWNLTNRKKNDLTKNISRVHFCVNGKRNRTRMKAHVQLFMTTSKNPKCAVLFANAEVRGLICRKKALSAQKVPQADLAAIWVNIGSDGRLYCRNLIFVDYHLSDSQISLAVCVRLCGIEDVSCILCFFCRKF